MVKVWVYTEADVGKSGSDQSSKYATDEFIKRNKSQRIEGRKNIMSFLVEATTLPQLHAANHQGTTRFSAFISRY